MAKTEEGRTGAMIMVPVFAGLGIGLIKWFDGWPAWVGGGLIVLAGLFLYALCLVEVHDVFCADCGQYLGKSNRFNCPCPRCKCNRYTTRDTGAGKTVRTRSR